MGFERSSRKSIVIEGKDVGDVTKINVSINGTTGYRCSKFEITKDNCSQSFDCLKKLEPCLPGGDMFSCMAELLPDGDMDYEVSIKTADDEDASTDCSITLRLFGSKSNSNVKLFSENGAEKGSVITKIISLNDIGIVSGYELKINGKCKWRPSFINVKTMSSGEIVTFELDDVLLISPGNETLKFDTNDTKSTTSMMNASGNIDSQSSGVWSQVAEVIKKQNEMQQGGYHDEDQDCPTRKSENTYGEYQEIFEDGGPNSNNQAAMSSSSSGFSSGLNINDCNGGLIHGNEKRGK
jgi:hypothetical protein